MRLVYRDESHNDGLIYLKDDLGGAINLGEDLVLLRLPTMSELRKHWKQFDAECRRDLLELFQIPFSRVQELYGLLGFREKEAEARRDIPYGLLVSGNPAKFAHLKKRAAVSALIAMGKVSETTARGDARVEVRGRPVEDYVLALAPDDQRDFLAQMVLRTQDLDEVLTFQQTTHLAWQQLRDAVTRSDDPAEFLERVAAGLELALDLSSREIDSASRGSRGKFYFVWFAMYLTLKGVWLFPVSCTTRVRSFIPRRLLPLLAWSAVPRQHRAMAELVLGSQKDSDGTSHAFVLNVLVGVSLSSTMWAVNEFRHDAVLAFKEWSQHRPSIGLYSTSANELYRLLAQHFGVEIAGRPEVAMFSSQKRLANNGVLPFAWVFDPRPRNTATVRLCLGREITETPEFLKTWALSFRELLPLFAVKGVAHVVDCLDTWLIYLLSIPAADAPRSFEEVVRPVHVNNFGSDGAATYVKFLYDNFAQRNQQVTQDAVKKLSQAWVFSASREGFSRDRSNPFDPTLDRPVPARRRRSFTARPAMELAVWEIVVQQNRKDGYEFARSRGEGRYWVRLRRPGTNSFVEMFWPAEAIIIDVILNSAARHRTARWLDSGEGDEFRVDVERLTEVPNGLPTATPGRREGFLRLVDVVGLDRQRVLGMFINSNKSGSTFEVPWIDPAVAAAVEQMIELQSAWNPMRGPIRARDSDISDNYVDLDEFALVYPLFRDPRNPSHAAISASRVLAYWKELLAHCQQIVNDHLGYDYPFFSEGRVLFDVHSIRVTMITNLLENGVDVTLVQRLVGHSSVIMTWYYQSKRHALIHERMQAAMEARKSALEGLARGDYECVEPVTRSAVVPDFVEDHIGVDLLRAYKKESGPPLDIFAHGICPGGSCDNGGARYAEGKHGPVWRPRACAGCRFRVTGPMFLNGLVSRLNALTAEIKSSAASSAKINSEIERIETEGGQTSAALRNTRGSLRRTRDKLALEWSLELRTIRLCEQMLATAAAEGGDQQSLLVTAPDGIDIRELKLSFAEVHDFELLHYLVKDIDLVPGVIAEIPPGTEEIWADMLRRILQANDMKDLTYRLSPHAARQAYQKFGDMLLEYVGEPSDLQELIEGKLHLEEVPVLAEKKQDLEDLLAAVDAAVPEIRIGRA